MRANFERGFEMSLSINKTFYEKITTIFKKENWNAKTFCALTGLEAIFFTRMNRPGYKPNIRTLMAVCVALQLDVLTAANLLKSVGLAFSPECRVHQAYIFLLKNCKGMSIGKCNKILLSFKIDKKDLLGTIQRKTK